MPDRDDIPRPPFVPHEDLVLVRGAINGDTRSVDEFVSRMKIVRRVLCNKNRRLGMPLDPNALEDVIQETLVTIWRKLDTYEGRGNLDAWAYRYCHHIFLWKARSHWRRREDRGEELHELQAGEASVVDPFLQQRIYDTLDRVGPPGADLIRAKHFEDKTFEEMAEAASMPLGTIKSQYYRAMLRVRDALGVELEEARAQEDMR